MGHEFWGEDVPMKFIANDHHRKEQMYFHPWRAGIASNPPPTGIIIVTQRGDTIRMPLLDYLCAAWMVRKPPPIYPRLAIMSGPRTGLFKQLPIIDVLCRRKLHFLVTLTAQLHWNKFIPGHSIQVLWRLSSVSGRHIYIQDCSQLLLRKGGENCLGIGMCLVSRILLFGQDCNRGSISVVIRSTGLEILAFFASELKEGYFTG